MKKNYFLLSATLLSGMISVAQPVLTASGMNPVLGDQFNLKRTQPLPQGPSGANQTWNLSAMSPSVTQSYTVGPVSQAPSGSSFTNANLQYNDGSNYIFFNSGNSALVNVGHDIPNAKVSYSNGEDFLRYPFSYNNTYTDSWTGIYTINSITFTRTGTSTLTYDGYGTLITPGFNLSNVARVHFVQTYKDTSSFATIHTSNDQYFWYTNGYHQPIASVFTITTFNNASSGGYYADNASSTVSLAELGPQERVLLAPNPASDKVMVGLTSGETLTNVSLFDVGGKIVMERLHPGENRVELDVSSLAPGIYLAKVKTASGLVETRKVKIFR